MTKFIRTLFTIFVFAIFASALQTGYTHFVMTNTEMPSKVSNVDMQKSNPDKAHRVGGNATKQRNASALSDKLRAALAELSQQQQQILRQEKEIRRLNELLAQREPGEDWQCGDDELSSESFDHDNQWIAARAEDFERALAGQSIDPEESDKLVAEIENFLKADSLSTSELIDSRCGETFCRAEFYHSTAQAFDAFVKVSTMLYEQRGETFIQVVENTDGSNSTVLFLARDGFDLSQIDS